MSQKLLKQIEYFVDVIKNALMPNDNLICSTQLRIIEPTKCHYKIRCLLDVYS